jgi:pyrroloquinoline quinone biosynthesis protein E
MDNSSLTELKTIVARKYQTALNMFQQDGGRAIWQYVSKKIRYKISQERILHFNAELGLKHPNTIQIEVSSNCNLRCPSCSLSREVTPGRNLAAEELITILDRLSFLPKSVSLNGIGEPLINPQFFTLVDILAERNINSTFFTNGTMLTERVQDAILSRQNISYVGISCDGAQKTTFEQLRVGAKFEIWKKYVKQFLAKAHNRQPQPIQTIMSTVVSKQNLSELSIILDLAKELGFRAVSFSDVMPNDDVAAEMAICYEDWMNPNTQSLVAKGKEMGITVSLNHKIEALPPERKLRCFQPWDYSMISVEGDVLPCCAIVGSDKAQTMGNILAQNFQDIWNGENFRKFRQSAANGTNELCGKCPYY